MKVLVLTRYSRMGASSRLRLLQYVDAWVNAGVEFHVSPLLNDHYLLSIYAGRRVATSSILSAYAKRLAVLLKVRDFDVLWIEKELFPHLPSWVETWLARCKVPYVVDYDDAIFHNYDISPHRLNRMLKHKIKSVMRHAAMVMVGNSYLGRYAIEAGARCVETVPTVIDLRRYPVQRARASAAPLVVGWIGSPSTAKFLTPLLPLVARVAQTMAVEFVIIGAAVDQITYPFARSVKWQESTEAAEIGTFDVGVMPLPDSAWERGKCAYKLIQYMACGKAVIASPVGMNVDVIEDGISGFLASTDDEWLAALTRLLSDQALRDAMGLRGRQLVEEKYCLDVTAPRLLQSLRDAAATRKVA